MSSTQSVVARVVAGHGVASGRNGDPRFPGGTLRMQLDHFRQAGIDLSPYHKGTINVSIVPMRYRVLRGRHTVRNLRWHPTEPPETFSFFDVRVSPQEGPTVDGSIYYPHPETKPEHHQPADVLELLLPWVPRLTTGAELTLQVPEDQLTFDRPV